MIQIIILNVMIKLHLQNSLQYSTSKNIHINIYFNFK